MIEVLKYELIKVSTRSFKRIINELKKNERVHSVNIENSCIMHVEYEYEGRLDKELPQLEDYIIRVVKYYDKKSSIKRIDAKEVYRKVLYLKGLDCAHCAAKIENLAKKQLIAEKIVVDFSTGRFIIETYDKEVIEKLIGTVKRITKRVDDKVEVLEGKTARQHQIEEPAKLKPVEKLLFMVGMVIFVAILILEVVYKEIDNLYIFFYILPYALVGYPVLFRFAKNIYRLQIFDENFLTCIASIGAFLTDHAEEAIMVMALYRIGEILQNRAVAHSRKSIQELLNINVKNAKLKIDSDIIEVDVESILPGDIVVVSKGESIPVDGKVVSGRTNIDSKNLTGESLLRSVTVGDEVLSGSVNMDKIIEVKAEKPYGDSLISKIIDLVENASISKGKTENFITKFAKVYTPLVVLIAVLIISSGLIFDFAKISYWVYVAMEFLVISCPCALVISIPLCYFSAIGAASKRGILVKGSNYIEALSKVENIVFDKTGTLTKGQFSITKIVPTCEGVTEEQLLRNVIYAEYYSNHPIGISVVDAYGREKIFPEIISDFSDLVGGSKAVINGNTIMIGNSSLMFANQIDHHVPETDNLVIHVVKNKQYQGYVEIGDVIKEEAADVIKELHEYGMKCYMLTGDSYEIARSVSHTADIDEFHAGLLPDQKVSFVEELKAISDGSTIFIGDGINDAPVIATAEVGIAMGEAGSDATIAISDVVIMGDDLKKTVELLNIARLTRRTVIQNVFLCLFTKFIVMLITLVFGIISTGRPEPIELPLIWAIFSDVGVSLLAILNSLYIMRLYRRKEKMEKALQEETIEEGMIDE